MFQFLIGSLKTRQGRMISLFQKNIIYKLLSKKSANS